MAQAEITLPPGCVLRKANSSDRLEFKQLERRNIIRTSPQLLVFLLVMTVAITPVLISYHPLLLALGIGFLWVPATSRLLLMFFNNKISYFDLSNTWYIKCQGRLVAWVKLSRNTKGSLIEVLFVEKAWRRRGLGSALVKRLIQEAPLPLSLSCPPKLVSFYSRLGFVRCGSNIFGQYMIYKDSDLKPRSNKP